MIIQRWMLNWRLNLFIALLALLVIGCYASTTERLSDGWWFEQNRLSGACVEVVRRTRVVPLISSRCRLLSGWMRWGTVLGKDQIRWLMRCLLAFSGLVLIRILLWVLSCMLCQETAPFQCSWRWSTSLPKPSVTVEVGILVSVVPNQTGGDVSRYGIAEENLSVPCLCASPSMAIMPVLLPAMSIVDEHSQAHQGHAIDEFDGSPSMSVSSTQAKSPATAPTRGYEAGIEREMRKFYGTLSEKDRRRYAAIEALKLGHGGIVYTAKLLDCSRKTVACGIRELRELPADMGYNRRIRRSGGGRKPYGVIYEGIDDKFLDVLKHYTAGDPMCDKVIWTNLTPGEIALKMEEKYQLRVSTTVVRKLIEKHDYRRRKTQDKTTIKQVIHRNEQFENIAGMLADYRHTGNPIISMDTKKKEYLGNFYRDGHLYTLKELHTFDHSFTSLAEGVIIPHGIYDIGRNTGYINIGTSKDTSQFACDSLRNWWYNQGQLEYPSATSILILCDGGGSNASKHYLFKEDLQKLANEIGVKLRIAHYPPYTSKYNPIEHRLFPHVTRACQGMIFRSTEMVKQLMEKTKTKKGLKVKVQIIDTVYETGRKVAEGFKENMPIVFDKFLPQWNYTAVPNG